MLETKRSSSIGKFVASKRTRCYLFFLSAGLGIGAWAASLPLLSSKLGIDKGELGLILLCFAAGAIVLMVSIGSFIDRVGSDLLSLIGCLVFGSFVAVVPFAQQPMLVAFLVLVAGAGFGTLDVSMNTTASVLERESKRHLMSSFHALFSVGNLIGAFLVGQIASYGIGVEGCLSAAGVFVILSALATRMFGREKERPQAVSQPVHDNANAFRLTRSQIVLVSMFGAIAFLAMLAEGGMMDWTAVYLVNNLAASESVGAYGFGIFAGAMAIGRFGGDTITRRIGHLSLMRLGAIVSAVALVVMLTVHSVSLTLICLAVIGLGVSNLVPAVFAAGGHVGGKAAGKAISMVTTMGYSGLLLGPACLGFIAQHFGLAISFGVITFALVTIIISAFALARRMRRIGIEQSIQY
ncbi:MFS transporter [Brucella sp. BE17]|uniref:MFS transporter n=1 Tax=Brucella sp. BE17 TaxID=3142977 RepID=UPI0031BAC02F